MSLVSSVSKSSHTPPSLFKVKSSFRPLHRFLKVYNRATYPFWEKLKFLVFSPTKTTAYLDTLLKKTPSGWNYDDIQRDLPGIIFSIKPYTREFYLLRTVFKRMEHSELSKVLEKCFDKMYDSSRFDFHKMAKYFDFEGVERAANQNDLKIWISDMAACLPDIPVIQKGTFFSKLSKTFQVVVRFFPNFLDTVLKAFNLIEIGKGPETLWDFSAMIGIYFKIFTIPYAIFLLVGATTAVSSQAILTTILILTAGFVSLCFYLKYRPCPNRLPRARNLSEEAMNGSLNTVIGRESEIATLSTYLGKQQGGFFVNLILVGQSGVGKTELVKGLAAKYKEKKIFLFNASDLAAPYSSTADRLRLILLDIKGHEKEVVFFIEELGDAIAKKLMTDIGGCLKPLLQRDGVQVIATATPDEYQEIMKDFPLAERFTKIDVKISEQQTLAILRERIASKGKEIFFEENIAEKIVAKTAGKNQPRTAVKLLELAMNHVSGFDLCHYVSPQCSSLSQKIDEKKIAYQQALDAELDASAIAQEIKQLSEELQTEQRKNIELGNRAKKLRNLLELRFNIRSNRKSLISSEKGKKKLAFLHWILSPWLTKTINNELKCLNSIPFLVDGGLIEQLDKKVL